jgi:predicted dithiol-disulfide oxidoreductase (DUF899 family)
LTFWVVGVAGISAFTRVFDALCPATTDPRNVTPGFASGWQRDSGPRTRRKPHRWRRSNPLPGFSVFAKDDTGQIFHTYSVYACDTEDVGTVYGFPSTSCPRIAMSGPAATDPGSPPRQI